MLGAFQGIRSVLLTRWLRWPSLIGARLVGLRERMLRRGGFACLCTLVLAACEPARPPWSPPDVLLISIDTLRADHLPTYGYPRPTAPYIDAFSREAAVFEQAYTHAPFTLPSHTSLLTGLYPERHGVQNRGDTLGPDVVTLAELLRSAGYRTAAFTNGYFVSPEFGLDRGFEVFDYAHEIQVKRNAEQTNRAILSWLDGATQGPVFVLAHYFDVHSDWEYLPYESPAELQARFAGPEPEGFRAGNGKQFASRYLALLNRDEGSGYREDELHFVEGLYDAGIAYADAQVGALLDALRDRRRFDRMIVVLTSDHGEEFQEHGRLLHTQIFQELVRIPFLLSLPEMRGGEGPSCVPGAQGYDPARILPRRITAPIQLVDVLPSLCACLGLTPPREAQGQSLLPLLVGEAPARNIVFLEHERRGEWGVLRGGWKLVIRPEQESKQLYHLPSDPSELQDVAALHPEITAELELVLARHREENARLRSQGAERVVPEEVHEALEALGYVREQDPE